MQKQDISTCIPLKRNIYALHFQVNFFLNLKGFKSLNLTPFIFNPIALQKTQVTKF